MVSAPPTSGPTSGPDWPASEMYMLIFSVRLRGKLDRMTTWPSVPISAPPKPCRARAPTSVQRSFDSPHSADDAAKTSKAKQ